MQNSLHLEIIAAAVLAALAPAPAAATVKAGVEAWQAGDYPRAVTQWRPLANRGDADAQFNMGQAYKLGRGVPADIAIARSWYEKAAQQGHHAAQSNLGLLLFQAGDRKTAMYWIRKAADRGDPRAQYVLGTALFNGDGVAKDWPRAYAMMSRAAAQGLPDASASLVEMDKHMLTSDRQKGSELARRPERPAATLAGASSGGGAPRIKVQTVATADAAVMATRSAQATQAAPPPKRLPPPARPGTAPAEADLPAAGAGGAWRVQLGAYDSEATARSQWTKLVRKMGALAGLRPSFERFGAFTRLRIGPLAGRAVADRLCAAAKAAGQACFPVAP
ncbi:MAG TPA: SPOR domain-containing protein [Allosphingosinicella sp.]